MRCLGGDLYSLSALVKPTLVVPHQWVPDGIENTSCTWLLLMAPCICKVIAIDKFDQRCNAVVWLLHVPYLEFDQMCTIASIARFNCE